VRKKWEIFLPIRFSGKQNCLLMGTKLKGGTRPSSKSGLILSKSLGGFPLMRGSFHQLGWSFSSHHIILYHDACAE